MTGERGARHSALKRRAWALARPMVDLVLPPRCPACGALVDDDHRFCADCWSGMDFLAGPACARCGVMFDQDQGEGALCAPCIAMPPAFDRARAAIAYGDVARQVALKLKYGRRIGLARLIAAQLERHVPDDGGEEMLIVPVPLHRWRLWSRGYNQSALIADALSRRTGVTADHHLLRRIKATPPLRGMGPRARRRTVQDVFALAGDARERLSGRTIILVDDVLTSGATAEACARQLKRGGAAAVHLLCWARVQPSGGDAELHGRDN